MQKWKNKMLLPEGCTGYSGLNRRVNE